MIFSYSLDAQTCPWRWFVVDHQIDGGIGLISTFSTFGGHFQFGAIFGQDFAAGNQWRQSDGASACVRETIMKGFRRKIRSGDLPNFIFLAKNSC